ncbi:phosphatase [Alkaliphilus peptidifermentans]|uniref:Putative hydrolase n=1 Tax=Alkaliphilus peptidifermentans DSM 18978 TaxID=1120976 RepID=A0A1G5I8Z4_9FIRM|nr:phosphatase [Alkaliphilus peptidifermentans]SCY72109.1 putative hydrolase [Alkaliphilus peptidifermentans DSM 18978]
MNFVLDVHCHSIASGHAFSTVMEMASFAASVDFQLLALTDHGPAMPGAADSLYFRNLKAIPKKIAGVEILKGVEVNILDYDGKLDLPECVLMEMDFVIASFHRPCIKPSTIEENTRVLRKLMEKPYIHMIGHPGNPSFPIDIKSLVSGAKETSTLIEINNSSLKPDSFRVGSSKNCYEILEECFSQQTPVALGSDAHIALEIGNFTMAMKMITDLNVDSNLIANTSVSLLKKVLERKSRL